MESMGRGGGIFVGPTPEATMHVLTSLPILPLSSHWNDVRQNQELSS